MEPIAEIIQQLQQALAETAVGDYALALAGAHAKGCADPGSDLDFFLYVNEWKSFEERKAILQRIADLGKPYYLSQILDENPWGSNMDFSYRGIPVETTVRSIQSVQRITADCMEGKFDILPLSWTSHGYFSYVYLSELSFLKAIDDKTGILEQLKRRCTPYPPKLRESIIKRFMEAPRSWPGSFHYHTAIQREDLLFVSAIVENMVLDLVQVIFAVNETYFKGDKKLERQLRELPNCPPALLANLEFLLTCPRDRGKLERQREILMEIIGDVEEQLKNISF